MRAFFSDDVVYHNIPMDPAEGIDATMELIKRVHGDVREAGVRDPPFGE